MTRFLVLYRSTSTAAEQMAAGTPEQVQEGMKAWTAWAQKVGDAIVDFGTPLSVVEPGGDAGDPVGGYSVLQAEDAEALVKVLDGHPHTAMGGTIEVLECLPVPGM